jgi:hypothetical protein
MNNSVVKMLNGEFSTTKGGKKVDFGLAEQVVTLSLETGVRLLLENNDDISSDNTRALVRFSLELDLLTRLHSFVDVNLQDLSLRVGLFAVTLLAPVLGVHHFSSTLALVTRLLDLLHHRAELSKHDLDTLTST